MIDMLANLQPEYIGLIMVACMLFAIFIGFPISFTLIFLGMTFGLWGFGELVFYLMTFQFSGVMLEQTLAAVPLFIFMGILMEQAGLMERLFKATDPVANPWRPLYRGALCLYHFCRRHRHCRRFGDHSWHHGSQNHESRRLRCAAFGRLDYRRRYTGNPDPAQHHAGSHGTDSGSAGH